MLTFMSSTATRHYIHPRQTKLFNNSPVLRVLRKSSTKSSRLPLSKFYAQFPKFPYNPGNNASAEFQKLAADSATWKDVYGKARKLKQAYHQALTTEFESLYGTDPSGRSAWQEIAMRVRLDPIPITLQDRRKMRMDTHVNIEDLLHASVLSDTDTVHCFASVPELSACTIKHKKKFWRECANAKNALSYLLRHINHPEKDKRCREGSEGCTNKKNGRKRA